MADPTCVGRPVVDSNGRQRKKLGGRPRAVGTTQVPFAEAGERILAALEDVYVRGSAAGCGWARL